MFEGLAQVICALAPEVVGMSFHDPAADTLWLSEDFLLPEDHRLVEDCLCASSPDAARAPRGEGHHALAIAMRDVHGTANGAVRLDIDSGIVEQRTCEPLEVRLAPVFACLAAEFSRRRSFA